MSGSSTPASDRKSLDYLKRVAYAERSQRAEQRRREKIGLSIGLGIGVSQRQNHGVKLSVTGQNDTYADMLADGLYESSFTSQGTNDFQFSSQQFNLTSNPPSGNTVLLRVNRSETHQEIAGFGAAMTDSSAYLLLQLKNTSIDDYNRVMDYLFNQRTGYTLLRVPIGASDYAPPGFDYTLADVQGNGSDPLANFNTSNPNQYIFPVLRDALARNPFVKLVITPWSAPAWMKTNDMTGSGGSLIEAMQPVFVEYLVKTVQAFNAALNTTVWGLSPQNEPTNAVPYSSMLMDVPTMAKILAALRGRFAQVGLGDIQLLGIEDNWSAIPMANQLVSINASTIDGLAFHCYNGNYTLLSGLQAPGKSVHMTECTGINTDSVGADLYSVQYWMQNMFSLVASYNVASVLHWNLALNDNNGPHLSTALCKNCIGTLDINGDKVTSQEQATMLSHHAAAAADLTRFNGSTPFRVGAIIDPQSSSKPQCLTSVLAVAAKWNKKRTDSLQRLGIVVHNVCSDTIDATIQLEDGSNVGVDVKRGLTTVVFASRPGPKTNATTTNVE